MEAHHQYTITERIKFSVESTGGYGYDGILW